MKLHAHKFRHDFQDGSTCTMKFSRSNRVKFVWSRRPSERILPEYRRWRAKIFETMFPGHTHTVIEC
jgi:hypothetical protein